MWDEVAPLVLGDLLQVLHDLYFSYNLAAVVVVLGEFLNQFNSDSDTANLAGSFDDSAEATLAEHLM
jgi:hypothetical protein